MEGQYQVWVLERCSSSSLQEGLSWGGIGDKEINRKVISITQMRSDKVLIVEKEGTEWVQGRLKKKKKNWFKEDLRD